MKRLWKELLASALVLTAHASFAREAFVVDIEGGSVSSGYNDVRIPGDGGTRFSLSKDLNTEPVLSVRGKLSYAVGESGALELLIAPLTVHPSGRIARPVRFHKVVFPADTPLEATYTFNSYRLTYLLTFIETRNLRLGFGLTGKIRDARIALSGGGQSSSYDNVGFVPLVHFRVDWTLWDRLGLLVDGDGLAAPQGRAEDVLAALWVRATPGLRLKAGYRVLEGGADSDKVYTFALFRYAVFGLQYEF